MNATPLSVVVVESEAVCRFGLVTLLNVHEMVRVIGEADTVKAARTLCMELAPDVIVIDPAMDGGEGFCLLKELNRLLPSAKKVVFSGCADEQSVELAFTLGVSGYIARRDPLAVLLGAVLGVVSGERQIGPCVQRLLLNGLGAGRFGQRKGLWGRLSAREAQILRLLGQGGVAREIAGRLGVSQKTVESHQQRIKQKLGLATGAALRTYAARTMRA